MGSNRNIDSELQGAGSKLGLEIWCVESLRLVSVPQTSHGKFFSGSAYVVLHTTLLKSGALQHDIHYWLGNEANEVDSALASDKALELDVVLGSQSVQYKEVQGQETGKFLSYFRPCIIPVEGIYCSGQVQLKAPGYETRLLTCKGDRVVHVKEVPFSRSSLNHRDVFILDTASKIFHFSGCNSSIQERAKALEVVQYIKEYKHKGNCEVAAIEDGKFVGDAEVGEFWNFFGGYAPIPKDPPSAQEQLQSSAVKLFWISLQGKFTQNGSGRLKRSMLESIKCYMLDGDFQIFVWMGRTTSITERKTSISAAEDFLRAQGRPINTHLAFLTEGSETSIFKSYFDDWPQTVEPKLYEEGRGKVAAMFKQTGYDVEELPDEDDKPHIDCNGTLKVWRVNVGKLSPIPVVEQRKLYSGDCYTVQYTYSANGREERLFYIWLGSKSSTEDRGDAISLTSVLVDSTKGDPVLARIVENKEPPQFFSIFQTLIMFKGGMGSRYKSFVAEKGLYDETYDDKKTALFRIQGTNRDNMQAVQVDQVSRSLNSSCCYILKAQGSIFTWLGNLSTTGDHDLLYGMLDLINPTWQPILVREGNEPDVFWDALGGKTEYPKEKEIKGFIEDPHLFVCTVAEDVDSQSSNLKVKEIFNFTQDDLTTEDVLVLDCCSEIFVWIGHNSVVKLKQQALSIGLAFLKKDVLGEGLSMDTPTYVVTEGHEPPFFTRFFEWDTSKANMLGNSFERKLAILKGQTQKLEAPLRTSPNVYSKETTPNGFRRPSPTPNGSRRPSPTPNGSRRPSPSPNGLTRRQSLDSYTLRSTSPTFSRSDFSATNNRRFSSSSIPRMIPSSSSPDVRGAANTLVSASPSLEAKNFPSKDSGPKQDGENQINVNLVNYPYERVKVNSNDPVPDIDITKREAYLSEEEFEEKFDMSKRSFYQLPRWKQNKVKMSLFLF
ncbi:villin-1 isoform X1 [Cynara cardunculus var. scolymus]|uniref:villin-1 isoform X1 n=1 Tax=Cynara cardunculus var. scolymus TaxID=59895 RepID=UPI000D631559|nr:villin-1 isoform X1 [Cynara cardunculus var. scolymus]XP_024981263.1 villin-1 isoform X1 [Cynara cardunculus var. scolymus]XP_024981264.1 villin-1 isoform X1 [Cynara cardunculus var. scolymus]XP_024981265.1 villin-1 isoform X1 [Cynara cardunculus var. scolymus]XP_024981266.1 villin-1 isoform X1 [Cynara cardunculus var. scolymus]XP_024981267.1 villin-1 isoform X1 [Cynara cardunculus var. scolymus]